MVQGLLFAEVETQAGPVARVAKPKGPGWDWTRVT